MSNKEAAVKEPVPATPATTESKADRLKRLAAERKALAQEEKAIREELNVNKDARKEARRITAKNKTAALEARAELAKQSRSLNHSMLSKSMKNNLDEFEKVVDAYGEAAQNLLDTSQTYIESVRALDKLG